MLKGKSTASTSSVPACVRAFLPAMPITRASDRSCYEPAVHSQRTREQTRCAASVEPG
jgi:hypothetical protein